VRRPSTVKAIAAALVVALMLAACGGGDDEEATTSPAPSGTPSEGPAPASPGALPPEFVQCMAEQGFPIESPSEVHSAPQQVLQACFGALHGGGGVP
jgi:ABC-type glycerol-3-phosphate transport system substrate-binding protein